MIHILPRLDPSGHTTATIYLARLSELLSLVPQEPLDAGIDMLLDAHASGNRVYVMGNGGSAATASHIANDLMKTCRVPGQKALRAFALTDNASLLTAWANDMAFDRVFAEYLGSVLEPEDVVVAISASGNSPNILKGLEMARLQRARTIGLLGFDGGAAADMVDVALVIPSFDYGLVEDAHMATGHAMSIAIRQALETD